MKFFKSWILSFTLNFNPLYQLSFSVLANNWAWRTWNRSISLKKTEKRLVDSLLLSLFSLRMNIFLFILPILMNKRKATGQETVGKKIPSFVSYLFSAIKKNGWCLKQPWKEEIKRAQTTKRNNKSLAPSTSQQLN